MDGIETLEPEHLPGTRARITRRADGPVPVVVKPFLNLVGRSGFAPFGWYRIAAGVALLAALAAGWL